MFKHVFVTGANRGIGLGFVRHYLDFGSLVVAACRRPDEAADLSALRDRYSGQLHVVKLDVTRQADLGAVVRDLPSFVERLDLLINNAGVYPRNNLETITAEQMMEAFAVNAVAPLMVSRTLLPFLRKGKRPLIVTISSLLGSVRSGAGIGSWQEYAYGPSKAAVNRVIRQLAHDLKPEGITVVAQHPGWVRTEMGGRNASLTVGESVRSMSRVFDGLGHGDTGRVIDLDGSDGPI